MINWFATALPYLSTLLEDTPAPETLPIIAVVNGIAWVGLFLLMLWLFSRSSKSMGDQISKLEAALPDEDKGNAR